MVVVHSWEEKGLVIYVPYDFKYDCGKNKSKIRKKMFQYCVCFDKQAFSQQIKETCHLFVFSFSELSSLCLSLSTCFCFTHSFSDVGFEKRMPALYISVCLFPNLSFVLIRIWSLAFVSAGKGNILRSLSLKSMWVEEQMFLVNCTFFGVQNSCLVQIKSGNVRLGAFCHNHKCTE